MPIANSSVSIGGTCSVTGGTARSLLEIGRDENNFAGVLDDGSAYNVRTTMKFAAKTPTVSATAPGGYTQRRTTVTILKPKTLANGKITVNTLKIELSVDPETTNFDVDQLCGHGAQVLFDSDYSSFWRLGAVA